MYRYPNSKLRTRRSLKGEKTRNKILKIAKRLFSTKGFAGASMDEIAEKVRIKKASLYHYFGSKQEIYNELIDQAMNEISKIFQISFSSGNLIKDSENFLRRIMEFIATDREYIRILIREILDENLPIRKLAETYVPRLLDFGFKIIRKGEKEGALRKDIDPVQLSITLSGAIILYFILEPVLEPFIKNPLSKKMLQKRLDHLTDIFFFGLLSDKYRKLMKNKKFLE